MLGEQGAGCSSIRRKLSFGDMRNITENLLGMPGVFNTQISNNNHKYFIILFEWFSLNNEQYYSKMASQRPNMFTNTDILLVAIDCSTYSQETFNVLEQKITSFWEDFTSHKTPVIFLLTKIDLHQPQEIENLETKIEEEIVLFKNTHEVLTYFLICSAKEGTNIDQINPHIFNAFIS